MIDRRAACAGLDLRSSRTSTLARWAVSPSLSASVRTSSASAARPSRVKWITLLAAQESRWPTGRWQSGPCRRWAARATGRPRSRPRATGRVVAQKHRAGVANLAQQLLGVRRWRCASAPARSRRPARTPRRRRAPGSARRTAPGFAGPGRRAPAWPVCRASSAAVASSTSSLQVIRMLAPGACSAWAIRSAAVKSGRVDVVGDHHHFARPGDRVDVDLAVDVLLGQGHEQVAGPDDLVDPRQALRRHRPAPPRPALRRGDRPRVMPSSWQVASRSAL